VKKRHVADRSYEMITGALVEFKSAEWPDVLRGPGLDWLWIDEAAYVKREAWEILRTRLTDTRGRCWITTTPRGKNWVYDLFLKGKSRRFPEYQSFHFGTKLNPKVSAGELLDLKRELPPEFYRQEYEAQFLDDRASVFMSPESCISGAIPQTSRDVEKTIMGVDLAKRKDYTVLIVMDHEGRVRHFDRFTRMDWPSQKARISAKAREWKSQIVVDATGFGDSIVDDLRLEGLDVEGVYLVDKKKRQVIQNLQIAIEKGAISYPRIPVLLDEMRMYTCTMTPSGNPKYSAPPGYHDDCVIALALANWGRSHKFAAAQLAEAASEGGLKREPLTAWRRSRLWTIAG
jgi:hypothetical protein